MKSPKQLAAQLARHWQRSDWREQHLQPSPGTWPLTLTIGAPGADLFRDAGPTLREHLQQWRSLADAGPGTVRWEPRSYRGSTAPLEIPTHWTLARPSECIRAITHFGGPAHAEIAADYQALATVLGTVDARFHRLLLRRLALWRHLSADQVITAARVALQLKPGCAAGKPLRALAVAGNDSKFFERHDRLVKALLDTLFDGEASRQGLTAFLGASPEGEHWVLVAPLGPGLLPFARQRVTTAELYATALPARHILLVENERCLHQLPKPLPGTIAILGSGLNLVWLSAPWLQQRNVAYWGDLDTWGLAMLAVARQHLPGLHALLMDRDTFEAHAAVAVTEPVHAVESAAYRGLLAHEADLAQHLRSLEKGRLEQEFLCAETVSAAVQKWGRQE